MLEGEINKLSIQKRAQIMGLPVSWPRRVSRPNRFAMRAMKKVQAMESPVESEALTLEVK